MSEKGTIDKLVKELMEGAVKGGLDKRELVNIALDGKLVLSNYILYHRLTGSYSSIHQQEKRCKIQ